MLRGSATCGKGGGCRGRLLVVVLVAAGAPGADPVAEADPEETRRRSVPVLMYHAIAAPIEGAPYPDLFVRPERFRAHMGWLHGHGYRAVTLRHVFDHWRRGRGLPRRPIVISFDDGYRSHYGAALPALRRYRWPGVLNLEVRNMRGKWGLPVRLLGQFVRAGWEIDAHTVTHPDLTTLTDGRLRYEVAGARRIIRRRLGVPVDFFCYPSGRYDRRVIAAVRAAGYDGATTTDYGLAEPTEPYTLERVRVNGSDDVRSLAAKLTALGA